MIVASQAISTPIRQTVAVALLVAVGLAMPNPIMADEPAVQDEQLFDVTDRSDVVGICYSVWHSLAVQPGKPIYDIERILSANPEEPAWGPRGAFHYWGKPAAGYYRGDDRQVIATHLKQLAEAGIDFLAIDYTNNQPDTFTNRSGHTQEVWLNPLIALLEESQRLRASGTPAPRIALWVRPESVNAALDRMYADPKYRDCWVYWDTGSGRKPLLLCTATPPDEADARATLRTMWGLDRKLAGGAWSFLNTSPQPAAIRDGKPEQLCVCTAIQHGFMTCPQATGRRGGRTFQEQWRRAFEIRPKFVVVTWWNEWMAQRFIATQDWERRLTRFSDGTYFVDAFDREFSRDLEPMQGGHGDAYYRFLCDYVEAYKLGHPFPERLLEESALRETAP